MANNSYQQAKSMLSNSVTIQAAKSAFQNQTLQGSSAGINLGNLILGSGAQGSLGLFDSHIKKYEVYELPVDILLLSTTLKRLRSQAKTFIGQKLTDKLVLESITEDDKENTLALRDYYSKKFLWWTLNEVNLTSFRQDLKHLINSDGTIIKENIMPLAYKMPEFYEYDMAFDNLMSEHNTIIKKGMRGHSQALTKNLNHITTFYKKRRHMGLYEYWFADENDNLVVMNINKDNPLKSLLELVSSKPIQINGVFTQKIRDNKDYFVLEKYSFL